MIQNESKYLIKEKCVDINRLAWFIWDYETGGRLYTTAPSNFGPHYVGWYDYAFPREIKEKYLAKAINILEHINSHDS